MDIISAKVYLPSCEKGFEDLSKIYINANSKNVNNISIGKDNREHQAMLLQKNKNLKNQSFKEEDFNKLINSAKFGSNEDIVKQQNHQLEELRQIRELLYSKDAQISYLTIQVQNRDSEINRLKARLDVGGINMVKLVSEYNEMQQNDNIKMLNHQIDYLNRENIQMDTILRSKPYLALSQANIKLQAENSSLLEKIRGKDDIIKTIDTKLEIRNRSGRSQKYTSNVDEY